MNLQYPHLLIDFLNTELAVPAESIDLGLRQAGSATDLLPVVLWQYGLVTTEQLDQIFDWLEHKDSDMNKPQ